MPRRLRKLLAGVDGRHRDRGRYRRAVGRHRQRGETAVADRRIEIGIAAEDRPILGDIAVEADLEALAALVADKGDGVGVDRHAGVGRLGTEDGGGECGGVVE